MIDRHRAGIVVEPPDRNDRIARVPVGGRQIEPLVRGFPRHVLIDCRPQQRIARSERKLLNEGRFMEWE